MDYKLEIVDQKSKSCGGTTNIHSHTHVGKDDGLDLATNAECTSKVVKSISITTMAITVPGGEDFSMKPNVSKHMVLPKAKRIHFVRNGERFHKGITIPVSTERYRTFEKLCEDITYQFAASLKLTGPICAIYTKHGKKITAISELQYGQIYVCCCNKETLNAVSATVPHCTTNKQNLKPYGYRAPTTPLLSNQKDKTKVNIGIYPRIVILIKHGPRPRHIIQLLLNKRNSPTYEHVVQAITKAVKLDAGYVRKIFTLWGDPVLELTDFFGEEDIFLACGNEDICYPADFELSSEELRAVKSICKTHRNVGLIYQKSDTQTSTSTSASTYSTSDEPKVDIKEIIAEAPTELRQSYRIVEYIGDGAYADVVKIVHRQTNAAYALKIVKKENYANCENSYKTEIYIMKKLNHPHIMSIMSVIDMPQKMYLIMEYINGGDLHTVLTQRGIFDEKQARYIFKQLGSALLHIHSKKIVHRDIKLENILVQMNTKRSITKVKLTDFGLATEVTKVLYEKCGTPLYVAPELLKNEGYGLKIDIWAAGIVLYILVSGMPPFYDDDQQEMYEYIKLGKYKYPEECDNDISEECKDLIFHMLRTDPIKRITSIEVLEHCWTRGERNLISLE